MHLAGHHPWGAALQSGTALAAPRVVLDRVQVLAIARGPGEMLTVALADDAGRLLPRRIAFP